MDIQLKRPYDAGYSSGTASIPILTSGRMTHHLNEIGWEASEILEPLVKQMAQTQGIAEQLKAEGDF